MEMEAVNPEHYKAIHKLKFFDTQSLTEGLNSLDKLGLTFAVVPHLARGAYDGYKPTHYWVTIYAKK